MPLLSDFSRKKKIKYFLEPIPKNARILEIGAGQGWVGQYLKQNGWKYYVSLDLVPPADIIGDVRNWRTLGLRAESFDYIVMFEVVEHIDCLQECYDILKPGGKLCITTPVPSMDSILKVLEAIGLNQKRTSPHDHLINLREVSIFKVKHIKIISFLSQWGIFEKD